VSASSILNLLDRVPPKESDTLTDREIAVLRLVLTGMKSKTIASTLSISIKTVDNHRQAINRKLKSNCTLSMLRVAILREYISFDEWLSMAVAL
jgi:two-component system, NarL family, nitrate/nitrite response regulator NarL